MPLDVLSTVAGSVPSNMDMLNLVGNAFGEVQNQKANLGMYKLQYSDAIKFWEMNNAYNTPEAQMKRFTDAGLNPHLIYGQGNSGNSSSPPSVPDLQPSNFRMPKLEGNVGLMSNLLGQADLRIKNAQADNLAVQNEVLRQDAVYRRLQAEREGFDLELERSLVDVSSDARRELLRKLQIENEVSLDRNAREAAMNASNVREAAERMLSMQANRKLIPFQRNEIMMRIRNLDRDEELKQIELLLKEMNIYPNDPLWARMVASFLSKKYPSDSTTTKDVGKNMLFLNDFLTPK